METLFENRHTRNKQFVKEFYKFYFFQRKVLAVCYVILFLCFVAEIWLGIATKDVNWLVLILIPLIYLIQIYRYFCLTKIMLRRDEEISGKEIEVETIVTDEYLQSTSSAGTIIKLEFDKIHTASETKNFILLRTKANLICILKKDAFTKGTTEEFKLFLKVKGIKIQGIF